MNRVVDLALLGFVLGAMACRPSVSAPADTGSGTTASASVVASPSSGSASAAPVFEGEGPSTEGHGASADSGPKMCGCSLCAPLPSTDACTTDADCAPSLPCHAPACVAKAKAIPRKPDQVCTMMMGCQTADANACTCWKGTCALTPRKP